LAVVNYHCSIICVCNEKLPLLLLHGKDMTGCMYIFSSVGPFSPQVIIIGWTWELKSCRQEGWWKIIV